MRPGYGEGRSPPEREAALCQPYANQLAIMRRSTYCRMPPCR